MRGKKITGILLAAFVLWALSACQKETPVPATEAPVTEAVTTEAVTTEAPSTEASVPETENAETKPQEEELPEYNIIVPNFPFARDTFPVMDGSTAAVPLGQAIASALLGESMEDVEDLTKFNRTTQSFRNLMYGNCDILVVGEPSASVFEEMKSEGFAYEIEEIATDALIFVVNEENPVESLTTDEIRDIYTGKITNWKEVGGNDAEIIPFQRNEGAGSQALIKKLIMKDEPMTEPPTEMIIGSMGDLMTAVKDYDGSANAIGYSVYYYANDMKMAKGLKILKVDGVEPCEDTIRSRTYPHLNAYYCVIPKDPDVSTEEAKMRADGAKVIFDWMMTEGGQNLAASMGYVSVMDPGKGKVTHANLPENVYTLIDGKEPGELTARDDYGKLIPYDGSPIYEAEGDQSWQSGYVQGFFDENGRIASAPLYSYVNQLLWYDGRKQTEVPLPYYEVGRRQYGLIPGQNGYEGEEDEWPEYKTFLVSTDGSFISEEEYVSIMPYQNGVFCLSDWDYERFTYYDLEGNVLFTEKELYEKTPALKAPAGEDAWISFDSVGKWYIAGNEAGFYILDTETLTPVQGPFEYVMEYFEGKFAFSTESDYGIIDEEGRVILPAIYDEVTLLDDGSIAAIKNREAYLFDASGNMVKDLGTATLLQAADYGLVAELYDYSKTTFVCYDFDGNEIFSDENGDFSFDLRSPVVSARAELLEDGTAKLKEDGPGLYAMNIVTGEGVYLPGKDYLNPFYTMEGISPIQYVMAVKYGYENGEEDEYHVIDFNLTKSIDVGLGAYTSRDELLDKWYVVSYRDWDTDEYTIYDADMNKLYEDIPGGFTFSDGLILRTNGAVFTAEDADGNVVFRYTMINALSD